MRFHARLEKKIRILVNLLMRVFTEEDMTPI